MNGLLLGVVALALLVAGAARRRGVSSPLLLVVVGLAASLVPGLNEVQLDPELVLFAVLPPLLYSAALESSYSGLRDNLRPIGLLAVVLPLITTVAVAWVAWLVLPQLPFTGALVLGAVVAPPDAVSATAIGRRLGLPRRIMTLLSGESLLNDATALTAYRVALAAAVGTGASLLNGVATFAVAAVGGVLVGLTVGFVVSTIRKRLDDPVLESAIGLVVPFLAYLTAEELHGSGVLAGVVAGLFLGNRSVRSGYATRLQDTAVWKAADVVLESFVFLLIGLQLPTVLAGLRGHSISALAVASVAVVATVIGVRLLWIMPMALLPRLLSRENAPSLRGALVVSWAGMRGVVSLAAAFAIPLTVNAGAPFPARAEILFLSFVVV
ncbi:MAG: Na+/H+ antiporter, partial [Mycobacteriaceae bacterium]